MIEDGASKVIEHPGCPKAWTEKIESDEAMDWFADYHILKTYGLLPNAGTMLDQDPRFVAAVAELDAYAKQ